MTNKETGIVKREENTGILVLPAIAQGLISLSLAGQGLNLTGFQRETLVTIAKNRIELEKVLGIVGRNPDVFTGSSRVRKFRDETQTEFEQRFEESIKILGGDPLLEDIVNKGRYPLIGDAVREDLEIIGQSGMKIRTFDIIFGKLIEVGSRPAVTQEDADRVIEAHNIYGELAGKVQKRNGVLTASEKQSFIDVGQALLKQRKALDLSRSATEVMPSTSEGADWEFKGEQAQIRVLGQIVRVLEETGKDEDQKQADRLKAHERAIIGGMSLKSPEVSRRAHEEYGAETLERFAWTVLPGEQSMESSELQDFNHGGNG